MASDTISIAFEIERTRKSDKRIAWKLNKLVNQSVLDGVVYVCETGGIRDAIASVLKEQRLACSPRIRHYGNAFLVFADCASVSETRLPNLYNVEGRSLRFKDWICALRKVSMDFRREGHFRTGAIAEPQGAAIAQPLNQGT